MFNLNWTALIAAVVSIGSAASIAAGNPALGAVIADPHTATALTGLVGVIGAGLSAFSQGVQHPATSITVPAAAVVATSPALSPAQKAAVQAIKS